MSPKRAAVLAAMIAGASDALQQVGSEWGFGPLPQEVIAELRRTLSRVVVGMPSETIDRLSTAEPGAIAAVLRGMGLEALAVERPS